MSKPVASKVLRRPTPKAQPARWTKQDIKELIGHLDGWLLTYSLTRRYEHLRQVLEREGNRLAIVLGGLRGFVAGDHDRLDQQLRAATAWRERIKPATATRALEQLADEVLENLDSRLWEIKPWRWSSPEKLTTAVEKLGAVAPGGWLDRFARAAQSRDELAERLGMAAKSVDRCEEVARRMEKLADAVVRRVAWREVLAERIESEGLPPDVANYTPGWLIKGSDGWGSLAIDSCLGQSWDQWRPKGNELNP